MYVLVKGATDFLEQNLFDDCNAISIMRDLSIHVTQ